MSANIQYYEILGVDPSVDPSELRKTYFRALKAHPVDKEPDLHQKIRQAYEILSDPQKRKEYDLSRESMGELTELLSQGQKFYSDDDYHQALKAFKKAAALSPTINAQSWLAKCYVKTDQLEKALKIFDSIPVETIDTIDFFEDIGYTLLIHVIVDTKNDPKEMTSLHKKLIIRIKNAFDTCIELNPEAREGYVGHGRIEYYLEHFDLSENWYQKAIDCDDSHDFDDFDTFLLKLEVLLLQDKKADLVQNTRYMLSLVPDEDGYLTYAMSCVIDFAVKLYKRGNHDYALEVAHVLESYLPRLSENEEQVNLTKLIARNSLLLINGKKELDRLIGDNTVFSPFKRLGLWSYVSFLDMDDSEAEENNKIFGHAVDELNELLRLGHQANMYGYFQSFKLNCPNLWEMHKSVFLELMPKNSVISPSPVNTNDGCGCLVLFTLLPLTYVAFESIRYILN